MGYSLISFCSVVIGFKSIDEDGLISLSFVSLIVGRIFVGNIFE